MAWTVYALVSEATGYTYVGVTTDVARRVAQHNGERPGGARATRGGRPWALGASWGPYPERGRAQAVEHAVKRLRGLDRLAWRAPEAGTPALDS